MKLWTVVTAICLAGAAAGDAPLYSNDLSRLPPGEVPQDEFLVLAGDFAVKDVDGNHVLEVPGHPLDSLGLLFGPTPEQPTGTVTARIWAATTGRRFPEFGVGSNDVGGYKLWLMPRRKQVAIRNADQTVATARYDAWQTQTWIRFRLTVSKSGDSAWAVRGKVWPDGEDEPKDWTVSFQETEEPTPGRASVWVNPYSGQPTRFDDLMMLP